ncbi:MAG: hypothetical protein D5S00_09990 [Tindallia sp. MSAO_Bac2]|nr:MAG: hypothetical protein D5S00_09990 [Tindallia sp. MSAO_Bac2]
MERTVNIAFMVLLLIPVVGFFVLQNRLLYRQLKSKTRQKTPAKKSSTAQTPSEPPAPVSLRERRKKRYEERKKALYR